MGIDPQNSAETRRDPFAMLGLDRRFDLGSGEIEHAFLMRLGSVHPDLAGEDASMDAAALMDAKSTLGDPEQRAAALLVLLGGADASDDKSLPDGFLMEMMELRGEIEEQLSDDDDARSRWRAFAEERRGAHIERVGQLFADDPLTDETLRSIRTELNAWRYTERLIEQLDPGYDPARADGVG